MHMGPLKEPLLNRRPKCLRTSGGPHNKVTSAGFATEGAASACIQMHGQKGHVWGKGEVTEILGHKNNLQDR